MKYRDNVDLYSIDTPRQCEDCPSLCGLKEHLALHKDEEKNIVAATIGGIAISGDPEGTHVGKIKPGSRVSELLDAALDDSFAAQAEIAATAEKLTDGCQGPYIVTAKTRGGGVAEVTLCGSNTIEPTDKREYEVVFVERR